MLKNLTDTNMWLGIEGTKLFFYYKRHLKNNPFDKKTPEEFFDNHKDFNKKLYINKESWEKIWQIFIYLLKLDTKIKIS